MLFMNHAQFTLPFTGSLFPDITVCVRMFLFIYELEHRKPAKDHSATKIIHVILKIKGYVH